MDKQRAKEIAASSVMANVTYNGAPIYIQNVDDANETASVYILGQPEDVKEVSLNTLIEQ
ncbi:H-type small acid-soluble spore protein [Gottfriedia acidiceleris]|uniref:H-type small acid-soluble spore protein n=1 Tax=Gottfriedia acidiceleris TaxID=371036 RepID=UPI0030000871